jgi:monofunctional glycosyltransferase
MRRHRRSSRYRQSASGGLARTLGLVLAVAVALLAGYESWRVMSARAGVETVFSAFESSPALQVRPADVGERHLAMLLAVRDPDFESHHGLALFGAGARLATISQDLAKSLFPSPLPPGFARLEQGLIAWAAIDPSISKERQLTAYLNLTGFDQVDGHPVQGFGEAARVYFDKPVADLDDDQFLALVAMWPKPGMVNLRTRPEANADRVARLRRLLAGTCQQRTLSDWRLRDCAP